MQLVLIESLTLGNSVVYVIPEFVAFELKTPRFALYAFALVVLGYKDLSPSI